MLFVENRQFYQIGFFRPHGVTPSTDDIARLTSEFAEFDFLPAAVPVFQSGSQADAVQDIQLQLFTQDRQWTVDFEPDRFLIQRNTAADEEAEYPNAFASGTIHILSHLHNLYPCLATRLSFVTRGLCRKMSNYELDNAYGRLFRLPAFSEDSNPLEWSVQQVIRREESINDKSELLNIVAGSRRVQTDVSDSDRIQIIMDINTFQGNQNQRFTPDDIDSFIKIAMHNTYEFERSVESLIYDQS